MKTIIRVAFVVLNLGFNAANGLAEEYHTPAHNYYQNNWMTGGG